MQKISTKRLHGMDALRAIAMLLGIVLHGIIPYRIFIGDNWPSDNVFHSFSFDILYVWIHTFRMPLFFLVAGFFARFLYLKIGMSKFIKHRMKRILLPFVIGLFTIVPLSILPFLYYFYNVQRNMALSVTDLLKKSFFDWNGTIHLWFLYYLIILYSITLVILLSKNYFPKKIIKYWNIISQKFKFSSFRNILILGVILSLLSFSNKEMVLEVYTGLRLKIDMFLGYGIFYFFGWILHVQNNELSKITKHTWKCLILGSLLLIPVLWTLGKDINLTTFIIIKMITGVQIVLMVFGFLGFFMKYFNTESKIMRYISDSSYWFYLVHLGFIVGIQIGLTHTTIPGYLRWIIALAVTSVISLVSYDLFVRYTFIGKILNGPRKRPIIHKKIQDLQIGNLERISN